MKNFLDFRNAIKERESGNNYEIVNKWGFIGAYQFGKPRLYDLGYSVDGWKPKNRPPKQYITTEAFKKNHLLQDRLFIKHVGQLRKIIDRRYYNYYGAEVSGVTITCSGLVAGAHLKGLGGVARFLSGHDNADALGTQVSEYIELFAGYDLNMVPDQIIVKNEMLVVKPHGLEEIKRDG